MPSLDMLVEEAVFGAFPLGMAGRIDWWELFDQSSPEGRLWDRPDGFRLLSFLSTQ